MSKRMVWTQQQDKTLKYLKQILKMKKWSEISKQMEKTYGFKGRNQKQCRERYHNHLDSNIENGKLTLDEEKKLYQLHDKIGNKWASIANQFNGRTDNFLKNFFYSKLRGSIRKLNRYLKEKQQDQSQFYPLSIVYKIVESCDLNSDSSEKNDLQHEFYLNLKNVLIEFNGGQTSREILQGIKQKNKPEILINLLVKFQELQAGKSPKKTSQSFLLKEQEQIEDHYSKQNSQNLKSEHPVSNLFLNFQPEQSEKQKDLQAQIRPLNCKTPIFELNQPTEPIISEYKTNDCHRNNSEKFQEVNFDKKYSFLQNWVNGQSAQQDEDVACLLMDQDIQFPQFRRNSSSDSISLKFFEQNQSPLCQNWIKDFGSNTSFNSSLFQ